jgi:copper chaperone
MYEFSIPDMSCGHCVSSVTKAIKAVDPDAVADVDLTKRKAAVETKVDPKTISDALENAGYPAVLETA